MSGRHGMVLGKFMPPHAGHVHLCEVAQRMSDELTIVVASVADEPIPGTQRVAWLRELVPQAGTLGVPSDADEPIPGTQRVAWLRELVPQARVVHHTAALPQEPGEHPEFWELWRTSLLAILPRRPDRVFTSDPYGKRLAAE